MPNRQQIIFLSFLLGFLSAITQIIFLREFAASFYGHEMTYAITLGAWLLWTGIGSMFAAFMLKDRRTSTGNICAILFFASLIGVVTLIFVRSFKRIFDISAGEIIGIFPITLTAILLTAPIALMFGITYVLLNRYWESGSGRSDDTAVWNVYLWEAVGACSGAVLFSFVFVRILNVFQTVLLLPFIPLITAQLLSGKRKRFLLILLSFLMCSGMMLVAPHIDKLTEQAGYRGLSIVGSKDSFYGKITITVQRDTFSLFENGQFSFSTGDDLTAQETVHYAMLAHDSPQTVLIIGGGLGGSLGELLKYDTVHIDYVELDPEVIRLAEQCLPSKYTDILASEKVKVIFQDGRRYVSTTRERYDVIIINLPDPGNAMLNRYYSKEFFHQAKRIMKPGAVLAFDLSSSANYLNPENKEFLRTGFTTVKEVFPFVFSLPGDHHTFLVSDTRVYLSPEFVVERAAERGIKADYLQISAFSRLDPYRLQDSERLFTEKRAINTDEHPVGYLHELMLWASRFGWDMRPFVTLLRANGAFIVSFIVFVIIAAGIMLRRSVFYAVDMAIIVTGFSEIIYQVLTIFAFQVLYGFVYYRIGLINAAFMGGLCLGTLLAGRWIKQRRDLLAQYKRVQVGICIYPLLIPVLFYVFQNQGAVKYSWVVEWLFMLLPLVAGFMGGFQYPVAVAMRGRAITRAGGTGGVSVSAGILYALDILGASCGAIITGIFLLPVFGLTAIAWLCCVLNMSVLACLLFVKR